MASTRRAVDKGRRLTLALAALLLLRALVPAGWMPVAEAGSIRLQPCPSWNRLAAAPAADASDHEAHGQHSTGHHAAPQEEDAPQHSSGSGADQPCTSSGLHFTGTPNAEPALTGPAPPELLPALLVPRAAIGRGLAAPPPPATGPPSLS